MTTNSAAFEKLNGIYISAPARKRFAEFEAQYSHLRTQEERIMTPEQIRKLPDTPEDHPHHREWEMRKDTISRFMEKLAERKETLGILDLGCGNGFFSHMMASQGHRVVGVDVCLFELEQAVNAFGSDNPVWYYADILHDKLPVKKFDLITFNASFQYFAMPEAVLRQCINLLKPGGEIHILESPFYEDAAAADKARQNSLQHFQELGSPGMIHFYHFNTLQVLHDFTYEIKTKAGLLKRLMGIRMSPFPWIVVNRPGSE